ncbi:MAG: ABC transporter ATP-binding protein [Planctomycetaceae bacterium]|nr:ABC transporter ATP-binding protein [Planctomycetaceae bacterium]
MSGIVIRGVSKVYGDSIRAVDGLDLEVQPGELLVVVGPSGSGKTTLLRLVAGLEQPTAGTICLGGRDLAGVPPQRRNIALVFQSLALYGHLTVEQNLAFALNAQTTGGWIQSLWRRGPVSGEVRSRIDKTARLLRIDHLLGRKPSQLSGGEQQRVALGRAIVREPRALLLDEPLSSLDLPTRRALRRELKDLHGRLGGGLGVPTMYVTHDQAEALAMGDRIAVLDHGRLAQVGTPTEIYERPRTRFVAEFFGPQGMNLIEGELLPDSLKSRRPAGSSGPLLVGIRPEHVRLDGEGRGDGLLGTVMSVESLGESTYYRLQLLQTTTTVTVRLPTDHNSQPKPGATAEIVLDPRHIHWFDATTGNRILSD